MKLTSTRLPLLAALAAATLMLVATRPAKAVSISISSTLDQSSASLTGGGSSDRAQGRQLITTNPGQTLPDAVGANVAASTRFIATVAADRGAAFSGGTANATLNVNYTVTFSVTPDTPTTIYNIYVDTNILGAATAVDDAAGLSNGGNASMGNVSGFLNNVANGNLNLASAASQGGTGSSAVTQFSANNLLTLGPFSGPQNFSVRFTWTMTATSPQAANGGDEHAVRIGFHNPLSGASADDYPGPGNRAQASDGHFVNISAEVLFVPEPSSLALAALGTAVFALTCYRRRRAA